MSGTRLKSVGGRAQPKGTIPRHRKASDLLVRGRPIVLSDEDVDYEKRIGDGGEPEHDESGAVIWDRVVLPPVTVWIAKLNSLEMDEARKHASRFRAIEMARLTDANGVDWQATYDQVAEMSREEIVQLLTDREMLGRRPVITARVLGELITGEEGDEEENEWAKDGYIEGLWAEMRASQERGEEPETDRIKAELDRFNEIVNEELKDEEDTQYAVFDSLGDEALLEKGATMMLEFEAGSRAQSEYELACIYFATRNCAGPDLDDPRQRKCLCRGANKKHLDRHFESVDEVRGSDDEVRLTLLSTFEKIVVDPDEGKDLRANPVSSTQSESPAPEAISTSSGPEDASE